MYNRRYVLLCGLLIALSTINISKIISLLCYEACENKIKYYIGFYFNFRTHYWKYYFFIFSTISSTNLDIESCY